MKEKELEDSCAEYVDECFKEEEKYKIGEIPLGWYDRDLYPDSNYGLFRKYLTPEKTDNILFSNGYLEIFILLIKNILKLISVFNFRRKQTLKEKIEGKSTIFFCDIPSGSSIDSMNSFIGRRESYIKKVEDKSATFILINYDCGVGWKEKKIISDTLVSKFNESRIIEVGQEIKLGQIVKNYFLAFITLLRNYRVLYSKMNIRAGRVEYYFLSELKKISSREIFHFLNQQNGYKNIFDTISNGSFIQTYSFLQIDRIPTFYANQAGVTTISIGDRLYTPKRPSNRPKGKSLSVNPECLPQKYLVKEKISKNTLLSCGISANQISVIKKEHYENLYNQQKEEAVLIYLQRHKDNPYRLVKLVLKAVENLKIEIVLKLHPRFLDVKKDFEPLIDTSKNKITIVELGSVPPKNYLVATTVFSTAGLEALESNIPVVWAPFISFDSLFVQEMFDTVGINTDNENELFFAIAKLCEDRSYNKMIIEQQKNKAKTFWDQVNSKLVQDYLLTPDK